MLGCLVGVARTPKPLFLGSSRSNLAQKRTQQQAKTLSHTQSTEAVIATAEEACSEVCA